MRVRSNMVMTVAAVALTVLLFPGAAWAQDTKDVWELAHPTSGELLYTADEAERDALVESAWEARGVAWAAPADSDEPVYRLFSDDGTHLYTADPIECLQLMIGGWTGEGICWYSDEGKALPVIRTDEGYEISSTTPGDSTEIACYALSGGDVTLETTDGITVTGPAGFSETEEFQRVEDEIEKVHQDGHDLGIVLLDLHTGRGLSYGAGEQRYSASTAKALFCAMIYERHGTAGGNARLVEGAVVDSSNEDYFALFHHYSEEEFFDWLATSGAPNATEPAQAEHYLWISAAETAECWEHIWRWWLTGAEGADELAGLLGRTRHSAMGGLLRQRYDAWCKPGWYEEDWLNIAATNDVGVVFSDCGPYVLVVMTDYGSDFEPLFPIIDALNACHGALCGGSTESLLTGDEERS
ncbi:MAG TPA: hypothetical protein IAA15_10275 [Candidatus Olsenella pullicola]|nr:hypothetical protein [Candidatus Olsenella pullicola]